jgi:hypothetical protein
MPRFFACGTEFLIGFARTAVDLIHFQAVPAPRRPLPPGTYEAGQGRLAKARAEREIGERERIRKEQMERDLGHWFGQRTMRYGVLEVVCAFCHKARWQQRSHHALGQGPTDVDVPHILPHSARTSAER